MTARHRVALLIGSLRRESFNRKAANALSELAPESLTFEEIGIGDLPLYNQDLETDAPPAPWVAFRERIRAADAFLFVTPEYNRSVPGALKNALDVGSRPKSSNSWDGRPGAVVSVSTGVLGGFGSHHHLRQSLVTLNIATLPRPEMYIGGAEKLFDAEGRLTSESTESFLKSFMDAFAAWVELHRRR